MLSFTIGNDAPEKSVDLCAARAHEGVWPMLQVHAVWYHGEAVLRMCITDA